MASLLGNTVAEKSVFGNGIKCVIPSIAQLYSKQDTVHTFRKKTSKTCNWFDSKAELPFFIMFLWRNYLSMTFLN